MLFTRTLDLVQKLQVARRELALEAAISKLDKYHLLILDDLAYVSKDQAENSACRKRSGVAPSRGPGLKPILARVLARSIASPPHGGV